MQNDVVCPHCKKPIPLNEALSHEIREKYRKALLDDRARQADLFQKKLDEERTKFTLETEQKVRQKLEQEMALKIADSKNESEELKKQNKALQEQFLEINKAFRNSQRENEQNRLELEKKLREEEEKIREDAKAKAHEENKLKIAEMEKKLSDVLKVNEDLNRKLQQGSQQLQGEVLELELENILRSEFPYDSIEPVAKGIRGGDIVQIVKNNLGKACGKIMWETKRTKSWSNEWAVKLRDDQRSLKAEYAVIVSEVLPTEVKNFGFRDGIWVANFACVIGLSYALRKNLMDTAMIKSSQVGKNEKMEILYNYLYGAEFQQRVEGILDAFTSLQDDLEKEKRWFVQKWSKQEKNIRRVIDNTVGLRGDLQSITGKALPSVNGVDLLEEGLNDETNGDTPEPFEEKGTLF